MTFGKNIVRSGLAYMWSAFSMFFITLITVREIPENSVRLVDTILGFTLGTIVSGIIMYYFGSSQSSADKNDLIKEQTNPNDTVNKTEVKVTTREPEVKKDGE